MDKEQSKRERYMQTYYGQDLIKKYPLFQEGIWEVRGEDSNCDFSGPHYMPQLGFYQGTLDEVIDIAVNLPNFWQWGGGGEIKPIKVISMDDAGRRDRLLRQREELEASMANVERQLRDM